MIKVRSNCFETNSSSTHAICIPKNPEIIPRHMFFCSAEYGWEQESADPHSYFYTAICELYGHDRSAFDQVMTKIKSILDRHGIEYVFQEYEWEWYEGREYLSHKGYIDHSCELHDLVEDLLNNEDKLIRYLSAGTVVLTGNDNSDYSYDWVHDNANRMEADGYECYFKGN